MRILITGGTGTLGQALVNDLWNTGHTIRITSRRPAPANAQTEWVQADLLTGQGLKESVQDVDVLIHCASSPLKKTYEADVVGSKLLLEQAKAAGVGHALYISITGIDRMQKFAYYRHKLAAEAIFEQSGVPYTISRITQFHAFADLLLQMLGKARWLPFLPAPTHWQMQTIDVYDVARYLHPYILGGAAGRIPDVAGPQVLNFKDMARQWLAAQSMSKPIVHVPLPLGLSRGFQQGLNTVPHHAFGTITWTDYLHERFSSQAANPSPKISPAA